MKAVLIAGTHSGCGKTTATLAVMQYLHDAGQRVAAFKAGPDFLDPLWHRAVTGEDAWNLDTHMMGEALCRQTLARAGSADVAVIEGVMGLFDGRDGVGGPGSSAHLAKALDVNVWLVLDASGMAGSIAALVRGFVAQARDMGVIISGIIANRTGSESHAMMLADALRDNHLPALVAWLDNTAPELPQRHLGLTTPDSTPPPDFSKALHSGQADLLDFCRKSAVQPASPPTRPLLTGRTIAIARDAACCFIYPANLHWLRETGANPVFFSPLAGDAVPANADSLWLPGGYPELYAEALSISPTLADIRRRVESGQPLLAECGGMMLLGNTLTDHAGKTWPMAGALDFATAMQDRLVALGYREDASGLRGHEFHHSSRSSNARHAPAFDVPRGDTGMRYKNTRASYNHWYFASAPTAAAALF